MAQIIAGGTKPDSGGNVEVITQVQTAQWKQLQGKPYILVSSKGIANGLSNIPNDGADFGPDTPGTQTSGIMEAKEALPKVLNYRTGRMVPIGTIKLIDVGGYSNGNPYGYIYNISVPIVFYDDEFITLEGAVEPSTVDNEGGSDTIYGSLINSTSNQGNIVFLQSPNANVFDSGIFCFDKIALRQEVAITNPLGYTPHVFSAGYQAVQLSGSSTIRKNNSVLLGMLKIGSMTIKDASGQNGQFSLATNFVEDICTIDRLSVGGTSNLNFQVSILVNHLHVGYLETWTSQQTDTSIFTSSTISSVIHLTDASDVNISNLHLFGSPNALIYVDGIGAGISSVPIIVQTTAMEITVQSPPSINLTYNNYFDGNIIFNIANFPDTQWNSMANYNTYGSFNVKAVFKNVNNASQLLASLGNPVYPSTPVSGTAYQNTNPYDVKVYVNGGLLSEIKITINGTAYTVYSNATASAVYEGFTLPAGASITLTYTTAPTWSWVPE